MHPRWCQPAAAMTGAGDWARALARASYGIELTPGRAAELAAELARLDGAAREAPAAAGLEVEPGASFRRILLALARDRPPPPRPSRPSEPAEAPTPPRGLAELSLVEAAEGVRRGDFSALELTEACLARIEVAQPRLNCFIACDPEAARARARRADAARPRGPLAGVPLAHKDMFDRAGRVSTCGARMRLRPARATATVLARLDAAGAIEIGTLNMSEFAAGATGHNVHHGDCVNPWKAGAAPGGSSSGSAAAVAARLVFAALGSDTGGSVRLPACLCGVAGLRPTYGRVSRFGAMARSWSADAIGPLAREVRDIARFLGVIAGADAADPTCENLAVPDYEAGIEASVKGLRVGRPDGFFLDRLDAPRRRTLEASLEVLRGLGADIVEVAVGDLGPAFAAAQIVLKAEAGGAARALAGRAPARLCAGHPRRDGGRPAGSRRPLYRRPARARPDAGRLRARRVRARRRAAHPGLRTPDAGAGPTATPTRRALPPASWRRSGAAPGRSAISGCRRCRCPAASPKTGCRPPSSSSAGPSTRRRSSTLGHLYQRETDWHRRVPSIG